ncbi:hypothetical protein DFH05DRAFT_547482 [Lentinula detonsa]|uniref:Uncharacterized protein n=1 Tax=Lentinula detonsa TaxID=2804962 RepID=A0A9W8NR85_9AGAR|nr:hypothetical protein DFH05DRAFT_547482 [Lentinula detonsa]
MPSNWERNYRHRTASFIFIALDSYALYLCRILNILCIHDLHGLYLNGLKSSYFTSQLPHFYFFALLLLHLLNQTYFFACYNILHAFLLQFYHSAMFEEYVPYRPHLCLSTFITFYFLPSQKLLIIVYTSLSFVFIRNSYSHCLLRFAFAMCYLMI